MINKIEDELTDEEVCQQALSKACNAFKKHLEDHMLDPAFFDIRFIAWMKDCNFEARLKRFEIEEECKDARE